jgi:hypothetical protein
MNNETHSVYICVAGGDTADHVRAIRELDKAARDGKRDWWPINKDAREGDLVIIYVGDPEQSFKYTGLVWDEPKPVPYYDPNAEYGRYRKGAHAAYIDNIQPLANGPVPLREVARVMPDLGFVKQKQKSPQRVPDEHVEDLLALLNVSRIDSDADLLAAVESFASRPETDAHRALKEYVKANPTAIGLPASYAGLTEIPLQSGDRLDVSFQGDGYWVAVEVKATHSPVPDIARGVFQCVKYVAVMNAVQAIASKEQNARAILVLEGQMPAVLSAWAKKLCVPVIAGLTR